MGSFVERTLTPAVRHRPWSLQLALVVLTCIFLFGLQSPHSHPEFCASSTDLGGPHQEQIHAQPGLPPPHSKLEPGLLSLSGLNSGDKDGKATDGLLSLQHSISHYTVNGLKVDPPPPPADEDEYLAICKSMCPHHHIG